MKINIESIENSKEIVDLTTTPNVTNKNLEVSQPFEIKSTTLNDIKIVHNKYFSKSVQNNIVVIANILYLTFLSNELFKTLLNEFSNCIDETEKRFKVHDVCQRFIEHRRILAIILKRNFIEVI